MDISNWDSPSAADGVLVSLMVVSPHQYHRPHHCNNVQIRAMKLIPDFPIDLSKPTLICFVSVVVILENWIILAPPQCVNSQNNEYSAQARTI